LDYTIQEAMESLKRGKDFFDMIVEREAPDVVLQKSVVEDPRYDGLDKEDRNKVGFHDVTKPTLRKDWNCPWIRRDGKGIKTVLRPEEKQKAPIRTSFPHFYSEPGSILAPDAPPMAPEELEKMIQERMGLINKEEDDAKMKKKMEQSKLNDQQKPNIQEERFEQNKMEVEFSHQQQQQQQQVQQQQHVEKHVQQQQHVEQQQCQDIHLEENGELDEEDSCPPDLESVEPVVPHQQQVEFNQQQQQTTVQQDFVNLDADSELLRNLAIAIRAGMEIYQGEGTYEPSADELIDVLKNLENLAAANPALYRAIVDQIKVCHTKFEDPKQNLVGNQQPLHEVEQTNGHQECEPHMEQGYSEVDRHEQEMYHQEQLEQEQQVHKMNGEPEMPETDQVQVQEQGPQLSVEELKQKDKEARLQAEVEKEHEEQMRQLKEKKRKEKEPPPPPKTITVMAGSRNKPAWPIAPGIANANQPKQITLVSGEDEAEWEKNRMQVAEAAGLKHIDKTIGDQADIYGQGDSAWSGSLRPTSHKFAGKGKPQQDAGVSPWAGSLRHVDQNKMRKKKPKKEEDDELYGNAPWMGTLRHVKNENPLPQFITPKFKKYPDEDAPNPFESMQGKNAKPVYPLTPAAVIPPGGSSSEAKKNRKQMEEVERITSGLRETRSLSGSLLKALMPKLLKEHESKYEPLGHDETFHIMEEILAMQIGLGDDTRVGDEDNDEAEAMIRAICHGEIDNDVYSKMADDLESAAKIKRKGDKPKKKKKKKTTSTSSASASELATSASEVSVK